MKVYEICCTEQIGEELARYATVLPIYVSLMTTFKIHNSLIFDQILVKLLTSEIFSKRMQYTLVSHERKVIQYC